MLGYMATRGNFTLEIKKLLFELFDVIKEGLVLRVRGRKRLIIVEQLEQRGLVDLLCRIRSLRKLISR